MEQSFVRPSIWSLSFETLSTCFETSVDSSATFLNFDLDHCVRLRHELEVAGLDPLVRSLQLRVVLACLPLLALERGDRLPLPVDRRLLGGRGARVLVDRRLLSGDLAFEL